jgi:hypothetical protein
VRRGRSLGGVTRGTVVAVPHLKQISAFSAISVPQFLQVIGDHCRLGIGDWGLGIADCWLALPATTLDRQLAIAKSAIVNQQFAIRNPQLTRIPP